MLDVQPLGKQRLHEAQAVQRAVRELVDVVEDDAGLFFCGNIAGTSGGARGGEVGACVGGRVHINIFLQLVRCPMQRESKDISDIVGEER